MRDHSNHVQVSYAQAVALILKACNFSPNTEAIPLEESYGRVLATDAIAQFDMPNSLTCALDSVAVHWVDFENGIPDTSTWQQGLQWEFANTGVAMPEGFDTAIVIEHVILDDKNASIAFDAAPSKQYAGTRPAGSRMHKGDVLVSAPGLFWRKESAQSSASFCGPYTTTLSVSLSVILRCRSDAVLLSTSRRIR